MGALVAAAETGATACVRLLLDAGADPDEPGGSESPIRSTPNLATARLLAESRANFAGISGDIRDELTVRRRANPRAWQLLVAVVRPLLAGATRLILALDGTLTQRDATGRTSRGLACIKPPPSARPARPLSPAMSPSSCDGSTGTRAGTRSPIAPVAA